MNYNDYAPEQAETLPSDQRIDMVRALVSIERETESAKRETRELKEAAMKASENLDALYAKQRDLRTELGRALGFSDGSENKAANPDLDALRAKLMGDAR